MKKIVLISLFLSYTYFLQSQITLVKDINSGDQFSSLPHQFIKFNNHFYFSAYTEDSGFELHKSDGTETGTVLLKDINTIATGIGSVPSGFIVFNNYLYFTASDGINGRELWKTDGTSSGTKLVLDIDPNGSSDPENFYIFKDELYFSARDETIGEELRKININEELTSYDLVTGIDPSWPEQFIEYNERLYFVCVANQNKEFASSFLLWYYDPVLSQFFLIQEPQGDVKELTLFNNRLYFSALDFNVKSELWSHEFINGNAGSPPTIITQSLTSFNGNGESAPENLVVVDSSLYFSAQILDENNQNLGIELCKFDSAGNYSLVMDIINGNEGSDPVNLISYKNELYFYAIHDSFYKLWKSDGTTEGTSLLNENALAIIGYSPTLFNDELYFDAIDQFNGSELWKTDGTVSGTSLVENYRSSALSFSPSNLFVFNDELFFSGDGDLGNELYKYSSESLKTNNLNFIDLRVFSTSNKNIQIVNENNLKLHLNLFDIKGRKIYKKIITKSEKIKVLKTGIYFIKIFNNSGSFTKKVFIE